MGNRSPCNDSSHTMSNHIDDYVLLLVLLHVIPNKSLNLFCSLLPHAPDVPFGIVLIGFGDEKICIGQLFEYPPFDEKHIVG